MLQDTFETAITWDRWPAFDAAIRTAVGDALQRTCGGGALSCRFTHVYPDGPAPYYSFMAPCTPDAQSDAWKEVKKVASDVVIANGGTITHHHAVGKMHRPWYDQQMPDLYLESLKAMKRTLDPAGILNPGVLVDP
jgi:alkyldihydroxyacetonephosphate synthase